MSEYMNFLIISDSHRNSDNIREAVIRQGKIDGILFLGDGISDFGESGRYMGVPTYMVQGNCDLFSAFFDKDIPEELILHFGEYTVMMMHGHKYGVKSSYGAAAAHAARAGADVLLFGHTHTPFEKRLEASDEVGGTILKKPLYIFNPGSIGRVNSSGVYSFGTMTIKNGSLLFGHGAI